ncbi:potassium channel subfamily K member 10-like [Anneissia japonica]|uniref:potassium channel subfamily K member 10-like n=1 Tax=Anneissia japonica TaxID=1529436 RepID=UPI001425B53C|nr:potassium channel subfamily K member 10-like [Anneissia japonica]
MNNWRKALVCFLILIGYLIFGGLIFHVLERSDEKYRKSYIIDVVYDFLGNNTCVDTRDLGRFIENVVYWGDGYLIKDGNVSDSSEMADHWDVASAVFFSATVVTTIGYGHIAPTTYGGCAFCVAYAFFGIPLTALFLSLIGECFADSWNAWNTILVKYVTCFSKHQKSKKVISTIVLVIIAYSLIILIPSVILSSIESWENLTGQYFCFISLSTIGFGDYVIGQNTDMSDGLLKTYKLIFVLYIIFGLSVLTLSFKQLQVIYQVKVYRPRVRGRMKRKTIMVRQNDIEMSVKHSARVDNDMEIEIDVDSEETYIVTCDASVQTEN